MIVKIFKTLCACVVIVILLIVIIGVALDNNGDEAKANTTDTNNVSESVVTTEEAPKILYEDDVFTIEYMDVFDNEYVTCSYIQLKITNNSDKKLTLLLEDVYVNDTAVQSGTGLPIELEPGKSTVDPFILFTGNMNIKAEEITKIEFAVKGRDENFDLFHTTSKILVNP